jgi:hypothetical protein
MIFLIFEWQLIINQQTNNKIYYGLALLSILINKYIN